MNNTATETPQAAAARPLRSIADLPGPAGIPMLGNLLQVSLPLVHQNLERWAQEFGPLYRVQFGRRQLLIVADHAVVSTLLRDRPEGFQRPQRSKDVAREMGLPAGVFSAEGDAWRNQRRMVMASFSPANVRAYFPSLRKVTQRLQTRWQAAARGNALIDLQADLMRFTVDAIAGLAFGADVNTLASDEDIIQRHLDKIFPALFERTFTVIPYWRWVRGPKDRQLDRSVAAINAAIADFIRQARQRLQADPQRGLQPPNLLEAMLVAADQPGSGVDDQDVAGNVLTMLLAGEDTTANTLAWMVYLLHTHPSALQRARAEVLRLAGDPAAFSREHMGQLDYLEACAMETMRLKPVAPNLPLEALHDTTLADVAVPAGTLVWSLLRHDSVAEQYFPQPGEFLPERWLEQIATSGEAGVLNASKRVVMPFGGGPRVCPGRYLALLEMKMAMAMLLSQFDIADVGTPDGLPARERMAFTMHPVGLTLRLRERLA
jgi:cytochrome P450